MIMTNVKSILSVASVLAVLMSAPVAKASDSVKKTYAEAAAELHKLKQEKDTFAVQTAAPTAEGRKAHQDKLEAMQDTYVKKYLEALEIEIDELNKKSEDMLKKLEAKWEAFDKMSKGEEAFEGTPEGKKLINEARSLEDLKKTKIAALEDERKFRMEQKAQRVSAKAESQAKKDMDIKAIDVKIEALSQQIKDFEDRRKSLASQTDSKVSEAANTFSETLGKMSDNYKKQMDDLKAQKEKMMG